MVKATILVIFAIFVLERIKATFFAYKHPKEGKIVAKGLTYYLIGIYSLIILASLIEFILAKARPNIYISMIGLVLLVLGGFLRNSAINTLKKHNFWSLHTKIFANQVIIKEGPYAYLSNPYYFGTMLELSGVTFLLNAYMSFFACLIVFVPVLLFRMLLEERVLRNED
ncbi:MAG: methyltransferase [Candidatus Omnitrophota bacterium]